MSPDDSTREPAVATIAAKALWRLLRSGFDKVDEDTYERRLEACRACEHCVAAPKTLLHALARPVGETRVCDLCGCFVFKKAHYTTERCPANRWGEPMS